jgi:CubicO group peptidase (beta-lactamase class C family)
MGKKTQDSVNGFVVRGFEPVRQAFEENFARRQELGAACCVYRSGEKVVDLWGGVRDKTTGEPWEKDTMVCVFSVAKGMSGLSVALAHSKGLIDYEALVCEYWPEFAQHDKEDITVRQLLSHQAGLFAFGEPVERSVFADPERLSGVLARQTPAWEPGTRQAYHAQTLGFYEGELIRRVDPRHRTLGRFFQEEIASPLTLDFHIRLPEEVPNSRLATISEPSVFRRLLAVQSVPLLMASMNKNSATRRAVFENPGPYLIMDQDRIYARNLEVPSGAGVGTARAIARAYSVFATGGKELAMNQQTMELLKAPARPPRFGFYDEVVKKRMSLSLGFLKPCKAYPFGAPSAIGSPGAGGSFGYGDPETGLAYAYVTNRMGPAMGGDARDLALQAATFRSIGQQAPRYTAQQERPRFEEAILPSENRELPNDHPDLHGHLTRRSPRLRPTTCNETERTADRLVARSLFLLPRN